MFRVTALDEVSSTNSVVKHAIEEGEAEGFAVCARRQTGGYGRQGRTWSSPEGGLYLSILLRPSAPSAKLPTLSLVTALAVRSAIAALLPEKTGASIQVKWPNDLVVPTACQPLETADAARRSHVPSCRFALCPHDPKAAQLRNAPIWGARTPLADPSQKPPFRKVCGISLEAHAGGVCVGIGVNVIRASAEDEEGMGGKNVPAYLEDLGYQGSIGALSQDVLREFEPCYALWQREGFAAFAEEYERHAALIGENVRILNQLGAVQAEGCAEGVDALGRLLLRTRHGSLVPVGSGEAHVA